MAASVPVLAQGKKLLMKAALTLSARVGSIGSVGLRELAREAGVDPTTFYRHFKSFDELGLAVIQSISEQLRPPLRELRRKAAASAAALSQPDGDVDELQFAIHRLLQALDLSVNLVFDNVEKNPDAFAAGARELRGALPSLRQAIRELMDAFASDLAEDIRTLRLLPMLDDPVIDEVSHHIIYQLFQFTADYVEQPERRAGIRTQAITFVQMLIVGAIAVRGMGRPLDEVAAHFLRGNDEVAKRITSRNGAAVTPAKKSSGRRRRAVAKPRRAD